MMITTIKLSSTGHVAIPKEIRDEFHWGEGTELLLVSTPQGITLKEKPKKTGRNLADLIGMLKHEGPPMDTEALCRPVDHYTDEA
jgi:AbrB family looped-hinge helix DNA binding protein